MQFFSIHETDTTSHTRVMTHLMGQLAALDEQQRQMRVEGLSQQAQALTALEARLGGLEEQQRQLLPR